MSELQMKQIKTPEQIKEMCFFSLPYFGESTTDRFFPRPDHLHGGKKFQSFKAVTNQIEHQGYTYCWLVCEWPKTPAFAATKLKTAPIPQQAYIEKTFRRKAGPACFRRTEKKSGREGKAWATSGLPLTGIISVPWLSTRPLLCGSRRGDRYRSRLCDG